jgi:subtilase family serine protease
MPLKGLQIALRRPAAQEHLLDKLLHDQLDRTSPRYHHWLNAEEFGWRFGVAVPDIDKIVGWLGTHGFEVTGVSKSRMRIDFSGTVGEVRDAFHTEIHRVRVHGEDHITNMSDPQIPAALAPVIAGVAWLNDFPPKAQYTGGQTCQPYVYDNVSQTWQQTSTCYWMVPADLRTIYNFPTSTYNGAGQTIVLLESTDPCCVGNQSQDWCAFRATFLSEVTCPTQLFSVQHPLSDQSQEPCRDPGWLSNGLESGIDPQWATAAAPGANIVVVACRPVGNTPAILVGLQDWIDLNSQQIISTSFGNCEADLGTSGNAIVNSTYQQADAEGFSMFAAAGDAGAALCDWFAGNAPAKLGIAVNGYASSPYVVGVGGTSFGDRELGRNYWSSQNGLTYGSALSYIPEIAWNSTCGNGVLAEYYTGSQQTYGPSGFCNSFGTGDFSATIDAGSGGPSSCALLPSSGSGCVGYPKPSWQSGILGNPQDGVRDVPDVSIIAGGSEWGHQMVFCFSQPENGITACTSNGGPASWSTSSGTSFSAPIFAGIQALINQRVGAAVGLPNQTYYELGALGYSNSNCLSVNATTGNSCVFYDISYLENPGDGTNVVPCVKDHGQDNDCFLDGAPVGVLSLDDGNYVAAYPSQEGWDFTSGIGSPNVTNLINAWPN